MAKVAPSVHYTTRYYMSLEKRTKIPAYIHTERCWPEVDKYSPCEAACPLYMDIPNYIMAISLGNIQQALAIIRDSNPLPSVCGRVCHHPCEEKCNRKVVDSAVAIKSLKRYAADWGNGEKPSPVPRTREERVAIIGSGPAGLTAAHDLVKKGYGATIFEALPMPGGILASAIPEFILPLEAVQADINYITGLGVRIHTNVRIGKDLSFADLKQLGFKAILIATGIQKSAGLRVPGSDLPGIFLALPWLRDAKAGRLLPLQGIVWVIGGGGVAMDVARTALRLGADEVHVACLESRSAMPAFTWEIEEAEREWVRLHPSLAPQQFAARDGTKVGGINFQRVATTWLDGDGRIQWKLREGPGSDYTVVTDSVIIAIGQVPDMSDMLGESLNTNKAGYLAVNESTLETNIPGIFAAGDASGTGRTVTDSMAAGRRAANSIDHYLKGMPIATPKDSREVITIEPEQIPTYFTCKERWDMPKLPGKQAIKTFNDVNLGYAQWQAVEEASRCLNCRMCANCIFERGQICFDTASRLL
jgi:NADPH-dependent glutamate synthase beta subunit-like oxidoreductase